VVYTTGFYISILPLGWLFITIAKFYTAVYSSALWKGISLPLGLLVIG